MDHHVAALAHLHVLLGADDSAIGLDGETEHVLGHEDDLAEAWVAEYVRRGARGVERVHPYLRQPVAERHRVSRNRGVEIHTRPYVSRVEQALHKLKHSAPAKFVHHQALLIKGAVKALRDPKVSKKRKAAIAASLALLVGSNAFPILGPFDDIIAVSALRAAMSPGRPSQHRTGAVAGHVARALGGRMPTQTEMLERRLHEARDRRMAARGGAEWTRARTEELALEEALFGLGGQHVLFNPNRHPRDRTGKFAEVLGGLRHGDTAHLPGGVAVTRTRDGFKVRHRRDLAPDVGKRHFRDAASAAAHAIAEDPTPRENDRIVGVRHRQGTALGQREVADLAPGSPVVTAEGEYGRYVATATEKGKRRAVVEFDHPSQPRTVQKRTDPRRLSRAEPVESAPVGAEAVPAASPGRGADTAVMLNPAGDALHFIHHYAEVVSDPRNVPEHQLVARSVGRPAGAQLRRAGIVTSG